MPSLLDQDGPSGPADGALVRSVADLKRMADEGRREPGRPRGAAGEALFTDLFVLELANNHWGSLERGFAIIDAFGAVARAAGVKAAIKLQFRDVDSFIHTDFRGAQHIRYVKKVADTRMSWDDQARMIDRVRQAGMIAMATPFDEISVEKCVAFGLEIIKIASSDIRDRRLIAAILATGRPSIMSTGGSSLEDVDALVRAFADRHVPLAINHCVSIYPSEDGELELNQVDFLKSRYPGNVIGFSTHEYSDWATSVAIAYGKGARTFERHIDIDRGGIAVSPYCSLPHQAAEWFRAFNRAKRMCGASGAAKRVPPAKEVEYLDALVRGVYAKRPLAAGETLSAADVYLAIPLLKGQMSCRELAGGERMLGAVAADGAIIFDAVESATAKPDLAPLIRARGLAA